MNTHNVVNFGRPLRVCIVASIALIALAFAAGRPPQVQAASSGLQYDQVMKFMLSQGTPQPGSFETDWQTAVQAEQAANNQTQHHGLFGGIMNTVNQAKSAMSMFQNGTATTEYFWNGWKRVDDLGTQTATITKPQQHQVIYLDLKNKTYRVEDTTVHPIAETPPPYQRPANPSGTPPPSPQPGTAKVTITASTTSLGTKTVGGEQAQGYKFDFKIVSTEATGSCTNGSFETSMITWDSSYPQPTEAPSGTTHAAAPRPVTRAPEMTAFKPGCKPKVTTRTHLGPTPPANRLSMWQLVALAAGVQSSQGSGSGGASMLIERGNVHTLGSSDASLFEIPAGFTKQTPSPNASP